MTIKTCFGGLLKLPRRHRAMTPEAKTHLLEIGWIAEIQDGAWVARPIFFG